MKTPYQPQLELVKAAIDEYVSLIVSEGRNSVAQAVRTRAYEIVTGVEQKYRREEKKYRKDRDAPQRSPEEFYLAVERTLDEIARDMDEKLGGGLPGGVATGLHSIRSAVCRLRFREFPL